MTSQWGVEVADLDQAERLAMGLDYGEKLKVVADALAAIVVPLFRSITG